MPEHPEGRQRWLDTLKPDRPDEVSPTPARWHADRARDYVAADADSLARSAGGRMGPSPAILLAQVHATLAVAHATMEAAEVAAFGVGT